MYQVSHCLRLIFRQSILFQFTYSFHLFQSLARHWCFFFRIFFVISHPLLYPNCVNSCVCLRDLYFLLLVFSAVLQCIYSWQIDLHINHFSVGVRDSRILVKLRQTYSVVFTAFLIYVSCNIPFFFNFNLLYWITEVILTQIRILFRIGNIHILFLQQNVQEFYMHNLYFIPTSGLAFM